MNILKFKRIDIRKPFFDPNPEKSKTNNHKWRRGLFIVFTDGKEEWWYMPTWKEIEELNEEMKRVEMINSELAKANVKISILANPKE